MKTVFIYYTVKVGKPIFNGECYITLEIYKIINNHPIHIAHTTYNTASFSGENTEVMNALINLGEIGIEYRNTFYDSCEASNKFEIIKV
ncbi:MAG: hypothetical protein M0R17_00810 [Candidatus Omnitrophica bacterium]|jgi:hypothetical protein|nr:hypothetical protein [Candidatus Omnitrophota bacterium]